MFAFSGCMFIGVLPVKFKEKDTEEELSVVSKKVSADSLKVKLDQGVRGDTKNGLRKQERK